jgi:NADPH2:quinone reductase
MKAIRVHETGGPEQLRYEDVPVPEPGAEQVLVKVAAAGLNFIDVYHRSGLYPMTPPFTPGSEIAGTVEALGAEVSGFAVGDRVASVRAIGGYAEYALVPAAMLVKVPEGIELQQAAAAMLQGMTAHYLLYSTYPLKAGETTLIHAAAGGVGLLLVQMAKHIGARVIGTVGNAEKATLAREAGADEVIIYTEEDFAAAVKRITADGVDVVYDSVGQSTFEGSLNCLRSRGYMVLFGQASGPVPPFNLQVLNARGSLFITRPSLFHYVAERPELDQRAGDVFNWIGAGRLNLRIDRSFPLADAAEAHRALEGRQTAGKVLIIPE